MVLYTVFPVRGISKVVPLLRGGVAKKLTKTNNNLFLRGGGTKSENLSESTI